MLAVRVDLQGMGETARERSLQSGDDGSAFATVSVSRNKRRPGCLLGNQLLQVGVCCCRATVIDNQNWQL
jgi:hypothetical protein